MVVVRKRGEEKKNERKRNENRKWTCGECIFIWVGVNRNILFAVKIDGQICSFSMEWNKRESLSN
jgi:NifU-like protein involved in Fe-S cluster formation